MWDAWYVPKIPEDSVCCGHDFMKLTQKSGLSGIKTYPWLRHVPVCWYTEIFTRNILPVAYGPQQNHKTDISVNSGNFLYFTRQDPKISDMKCYFDSNKNKETFLSNFIILDILLVIIFCRSVGWNVNVQMHMLKYFQEMLVFCVTYYEASDTNLDTHFTKKCRRSKIDGRVWHLHEGWRRRVLDECFTINGQRESVPFLK